MYLLQRMQRSTMKLRVVSLHIQQEVGSPELRRNPTRGEGTLGTTIYHLRPRGVRCMLDGETDGGGLAMVVPVAGLTMGMALRARVADG